MLTTLLPWAALVLAILAVLARDGARESAQSEGTWLQAIRANAAHFIAVWALILASLACGWIWQEELKGLWPTALGFAGGCFMMSEAAKKGLLRGQPVNGLAGPAAIGVLGAAAWTLIPVDLREPYQLGAMAGAGIAAWVIAGSARGVWASRAAIFMILALAGDVLGKRAAGGHSAQAGSVFGLLVVVAMLLALAIPRNAETASRNRLIGIVLGVIVLGVGAWLLSMRHFFISDLWIIFAGAVLVGAIVAWLTPDAGDKSSLGFILSVIIWLAVATLAFGLRKGYGMSVACLGGAAVLTMLGRSRALLTLGPLAILVLYRVFRELHTDASRAIDIGQHYALIGLSIGVALPILAMEWRTSRSEASSKSAAASGLWTPAFLAVPFVSAVVLAAKGYVGVLTGLGFASLVEGLKGSSRLDSLALQLGIGASMVASFEWVSSKVDLARDEKVKTLVWVAAGIGLLALLISMLSRASRVESSRSTE